LVDPVQAAEPLLRDGADQPVLGTFLASNANYLVTGDKDLLALSALYPIVTPAEFWQLHGNEENLIVFYSLLNCLARCSRRYSCRAWYWWY